MQKEIRNQQAQNLNALGKRLGDAVTALFTAGEITTLFETAARFNNLSPSNKVLLAKAMPDAAYIATRDEWKDLGRTILPDAVPVLLTAPGLSEPDRDGARHVCLRTREYFDVSQTEGAELDFGLEPRIYREDLLIRAVREISASDGVPVRLTVMLQSDGICHSKVNRDGMVERSISIRNDLEPQAMARTLLHEIAHSLLHGHSNAPPSTQPLTKDEQTDLCEVEAEAVAYIRASHFGIMDDVHSTEYIGAHLHDDVYRTLAGQYQRIMDVAASIVHRTEVQYERERMTERCQGDPKPGYARLYQLKDSQCKFAKLNQTMDVFDRRLFNAVCEIPLPDARAPNAAWPLEAIAAIRDGPPPGYAGREPAVTDVVEIGTQAGPIRYALQRDGPHKVAAGKVNMQDRRPQKKAVPVWQR